MQYEHPFRYFTLVLILFMIGIGLHTSIVQVMGDDVERVLLAPTVLMAALLFGAGGGALSEIMRQTKNTLHDAWTKGGAHMLRALLWAALLPAIYLDDVFLPMSYYALMSLVAGKITSLLLAVFSILAYSALTRIVVGYSTLRFSEPKTQLFTEGAIILGTGALLLLLCSPFFPNISPF